MRGVPLPVVQSIVGHLTASMTRHYQSHADKKARMQGLALMRGLTAGENTSCGMPGYAETGNILRQRLLEYIHMASDMEILKLNVLIAQLADSAHAMQQEPRRLDTIVNE